MLHTASPLQLHQSPPDGALHHHLQSLPPNLQGLDAIATDPNDAAIFQQHLTEAHAHQAPHRLHAPNPFEHNGGLPHSPAQFQSVQALPYQHAQNRFNLIAPPPPQSHPHHYQAPLPPPPIPRHPERIPDFESQTEFGQAQTVPHELDDVPVTASHSQFEGLRLIPDPPNLEEWREKLFHVDDTITLTEDDFQTYFPHIDNVYSHRSTQRHKRKRFVSHYWDCRLKGRPPGTKKSTDPDKKKRKRVARERDLCDVKIKITEYFDGAELTEQTGQQPPVDNMLDGSSFFGQPRVSAQTQLTPWGVTNMQNMPTGLHLAQPAPPPKKFYTIQRVNGNGGNGKGDGIAGPHKHSLEESDKVKKNSVVRWMMKNEKDKKKAHGGDPQKKTYHKKATGLALTTAKQHSKDEDLKLFGSCFCPFVQRVWISLEFKGVPYQYIEVDPYKKPQSLLEVSPKGLVPAIRHGPTWSVHESTVIMEYLEDLQTGTPLLPSHPQKRATCRLWSDHINRNIVPCFYRLLQAQDAEDQVNHATDLRNEISKLVEAADPQGPFFAGQTIGFVDVQMAPWVIRLKKVLGPYRGWPEPEEGSRWATWVSAIENEEHVKRTTSDDGLYLDSYERYAENRPNTSQLANAVNSGRGLP
ncbi:hypothetical protein EJ04DRAFT_195290 [Polyplosphaeria fusca]|uniref:GST N-terminal domain-containing protein n=1 Tax=Polyplosphaeria fusca TaxID=682080 RepID=A0A9P4QZS7_9PLEO|nr:hypothetical protein EJ04DRAFT_195290 [Polyplosphaeria fusca]